MREPGVRDQARAAPPGAREPELAGSLRWQLRFVARANLKTTGAASGGLRRPTVAPHAPDGDLGLPRAASGYGTMLGLNLGSCVMGLRVIGIGVPAHATGGLRPRLP